MPTHADALVLSSSFTLPERPPSRIRIGTHLGKMHFDPSNPAVAGFVRYHFRFQNGHLMEVIILPGRRQANVEFLTCDRSAQSSISFSAVKRLLEEVSRSTLSPQLSSISQPLLKRHDSPWLPNPSSSETLLQFASDARTLEKAVDAKAMQLARIVISRIPEVVREWAENWLVSERSLAMRLKTYGNESILFATRLDPLKQNFKDMPDFQRKMALLKEAWQDILVLEVDDRHATKVEITARPLHYDETSRHRR